MDAAQYIVNELQQNNQINVNYLPLDEMRMDDLGLYDARGHKIDVLIRLYPLYRFCRAGIPHRKKPGCTLDHRMLHECLIRRQLVMLNTPLATVLETKAIQALIWRLYESGVYFGQKDRELIHRYFLRTTFEPPPGQDPVVVKPMYGGGGSDVIVSDPDGNILERGRTSHNKGDPCIYQEYVEPPEVETMTEDGVKTLRVIVSAWVIDGRYVGVSYRTGQGITDASWWISPIYVGERISI